MPASEVSRLKAVSAFAKMGCVRATLMKPHSSCMLVGSELWGAFVFPQKFGCLGRRQDKICCFLDVPCIEFKCSYTKNKNANIIIIIILIIITIIIIIIINLCGCVNQPHPLSNSFAKKLHKEKKSSSSSSSSSYAMRQSVAQHYRESVAILAQSMSA